jgi:hypothetical protein
VTGRPVVCGFRHPAQHYARCSALLAYHTGQGLWTVEATDRLCRSIRADLERQFGEPRNEINPAHFIVEQAFWDGDHMGPRDSLELSVFCELVASRTSSTIPQRGFGIRRSPA